MFYIYQSFSPERKTNSVAVIRTTFLSQGVHSIVDRLYFIFLFLSGLFWQIFAAPQFVWLR